MPAIRRGLHSKSTGDGEAGEAPAVLAGYWSWRNIAA